MKKSLQIFLFLTGITFLAYGFYQLVAWEVIAIFSREEIYGMLGLGFVFLIAGFVVYKN